MSNVPRMYPDAPHRSTIKTSDVAGRPRTTTSISMNVFPDLGFAPTQGRQAKLVAIRDCRPDQEVRRSAVPILAKRSKPPRTCYAQIRLGRDPVAEKKQARVRAGETMAAVLPLYLARQRTQIAAQQLQPDGAQSASLCAIAARFANRRYRSPHDRGAAAGGRATEWPTGELSVAKGSSCLLGLGRGRGVGRHNEAAYTNAPAVNGPRTRVLTGDELRTIWGALEDDVLGAAVKLLMLTACRRNEIGKLSWSEVDLTAAKIDLPGERTKNHKPHRVPLARRSA